MASKSTKKPRAVDSEAALFGLPLKGWLQGTTSGNPTAGGPMGHLLMVCGSEAEVERTVKDKLDKIVPGWQREWLKQKRTETFMFATESGPIWLIRLKDEQSAKAASHGGLFVPSAFARARDLVGQMVNQLRDFGLSELHIDVLKASPEHVEGLLVGLEVGAYRYLRARQPGPSDRPLPRLVFTKKLPADLLERASALGCSVNIARHLVNLPPADLTPKTYAEAIVEAFTGSGSMEVHVWSGERLKKERLGLLVAVGAGAADGPALVHLRYRPKGKMRLAKPIAFVGKGVTFDSGGLDIKPASGMRLMKKDMGGSAALMGLAWFVHKTEPDVACDIYLALAENAVDQNSFHPGDVIRARNGLTVEIHNTDAEGRLVMADALDVAVTQEGKDEPCAVIDVSTLTGAMRVSVGTTLAGMFSNHDGLADAMLVLGKHFGDPCWRQPLFEDYRSMLKSTFADLSNCSDSPFAGAITAALFLQRFVKGKPWVHFDAYCWADKSGGAIAEPGGNGQTVQLLAGFLDLCKPAWFVSEPAAE